MFRVNMVYFSLFFILFFSNNKILRRYLNTLSSFSLNCRLTKLMDTIEYMNGQKQSRKDPDETVRMHTLILIFAIRMQ